MILFKEVTKQYPTGNVVLDNVSFDIKPGEFVIITGESGAGKTTMARLMIKDIEPTSGEIFVDGENLADIKPQHVHTLRKKVGVIFQDYKIIPDKTVGENIALTLQIIGFTPEKIAERILHLLDLVGIPQKKDLFPVQLSGGELQRAAIARAIAAQPTILFADEPTGNLDINTANDIMKLLKKINSSETTVLVATHNLDFTHLGDRHLHLEKGKITSDMQKPVESSSDHKIKAKKNKTKEE